jgi:TonB-linked SusC/RagA family outer membrane protein
MKLRFYFFCIFFLTFSVRIVLGQTVSVSGIIKGDDGDPVPGASVVLKGTHNGVVSDLNGNYLIEVPELKGSLIVSHIGYQTKELLITSKSLNVILHEDVKLLHEVVAVGYGTSRKIDITGAVSSIKSDAAEQRLVLTVADMLKGKISGVKITSTDGAPGSGQSINIRGNTSLSGDSNPLYVIDGFLSEFCNVSPGDVESIDILKDASSTAIYGSRGANGVILITTKKGKKNQNRINFYAMSGVQTPVNLLDMMDSQSFIEKNYFFNLTYVPKAKWKPTSFKPAAYDFYQDPEGNFYVISKKAAYADYYNGDREIQYNTDWQKEMMRNAMTHDYRVDMSGGGEKNTYAVMFGYKSQEGIMIKSDYTNYSARANFSQQLMNNINLTLHSSLDRNFKSGFGSETEGVIYNTLTQAPIRPSNFDPAFLLPGESSASATVVNPVSQANLITNNVDNYSFLANGSLDINLMKNFTARFNGGYFLFAQTNEEFYPSKVAQGMAFGGRAYIGNSKSERLSNENTLTYSNSFNSIHKITLLAGNSIEQVVSKWLNTENRGFVLEDLGINGISQGNNPQIPTSTYIKQTNASFFSRINYDIADKYLLKFTIRADGSSRFAKNNKWGYFPSAAAAWRISEEDFIKKLNVFSNLKLRTSWGISGKQAIPSYQSLPAVGTWNVSIDGSTNSLISYFTRIANENLKWETTHETNLGIDFGFLKGRLTLSTDVYNRETKDLLYYEPIPTYTGYDIALRNIGRIQNRGTEISLFANIVNSKNVNWDFNFNISKNISKIIELGEQDWKLVDVGYIGTGQGYLQEGKPLGNWYGYKTDGLWQTQSEIDQAIAEGKLLASEGIKPGYVKYVDLNGDGKKTAEDRQILGHGEPDFTGGFTNSFSYKGLALDLTFQYSVGNSIYNATRYRLESGFSLDNALAETKDRWRPTLYYYDPVAKQRGDLYMEGNSTNRYPIAVMGKSIDEVPIDNWIEDGSFIRLSDVTLSYSFSTQLLQKIKLNNLRFFISANNVFVLTKYSGYDPEVNKSQGEASFLMPGLDYFSYPRARTFAAGINMTL